jgi:hypothetical protein
MAQPQSYRNHAQFVPLYHFILLPILLVNILAMGYQLFRDPGMFTAWYFVMAIALFLTALFARVFALKAQDRVIRLEERLRMRERLEGDLRQRINDFTGEQLIALRFASDAELPDLAARVLRDDVQKRDAIKKMIKDWRPDTFRV